MNTLIFEGAGWAGAEHNGVGNCRIRTRIKNRDGRLIYLEMGGGHVDYGRVDHCFYCDSKWDSRSNHSKDLAKFERAKFEYTKETILAFVNKNLNCTFLFGKSVTRRVLIHFGMRSWNIFIIIKEGRLDHVIFKGLQFFGSCA